MELAKMEMRLEVASHLLAILMYIKILFFQKILQDWLNLLKKNVKDIQ